MVEGLGIDRLREELNQLKELWEKFRRREIEEEELEAALREIEQEYLVDDRPISLVHRKKPREIFYFRAKPRTAYRPTEPQIRARLRFAELASKARGRKFKVDGKFVADLPPAAEMVKRMRGESFGRTAKPKKWEAILVETLRRGGE